VETFLAIASRRDERRYLPKPLPRTAVERVLDAGRLSGSSRLPAVDISRAERGARRYLARGIVPGTSSAASSAVVVRRASAVRPGAPP
jgi:hypothetical protein